MLLFLVVSVALPDPILPLPFPVSPLPFPVLSFPVFLMCHIRMKIGLSRSFSS